MMTIAIKSHQPHHILYLFYLVLFISCYFPFIKKKSRFVIFVVVVLVMNAVVVLDFDETLCPSRLMRWDETVQAAVWTGDEGHRQLLDILDDVNVALLLECQKYADLVCILSNATSSWVYVAMRTFLPRTWDLCCQQNITVINGPDLFYQTTQCPLLMKKLGMATICDPFISQIQTLVSIGDDLPEYLACINYAKENAIPKYRTVMMEKMNPPNVAGQIEMLRFVKQWVHHYIHEDERPNVHVAIACRYDEPPNQKQTKE